jgi:hypothetical protein
VCAPTRVQKVRSHGIMGAVMSVFEDCFKGRRAAFGNRRRHLVNLQDMGVDIYEPAGAHVLPPELPDVAGA